MSRRGDSARHATPPGVRLTARGVLFLVFGVVMVIVAYASGRSVLISVGALLILLPIVCTLLLVVRRPRLAVARIHPPVFEAERTTIVQVHVTNTRGLRTPAMVIGDSVPWAHSGDLFSVPPLWRGAAAVAEYQLTPPERGVFSLGPLRVQIADPFGLSTAIVMCGDDEQITVVPTVVPLGESGLSVASGVGEARLVHRRPAADEDDAITREYRDGDAMRRVHWRATARHGELMVRQEEQRSLPRATILLDTRRQGYADSQPGDTTSPGFEWAVRMLASTVVHLRRTGFHVEVQETAHRQVVLEHGSEHAEEEFLLSLATISLVAHAADAAPAVVGAGPVIALASTPDADIRRWLRAARRSDQLAVVYLVRGGFVLPGINFSDVEHNVSTLSEFGDDGWLVVPVDATADPSHVWQAVVYETGRSHGA